MKKILHRYFVQKLQAISTGFITKEMWLSWLQFPDSFPLKLVEVAPINSNELTVLRAWVAKQNAKDLPNALEKLYQQHQENPNELSNQYDNFLEMLFVPCMAYHENLNNSHPNFALKKWRVDFSLTLTSITYRELPIGGVVYIKGNLNHDPNEIATKEDYREIFTTLKKIDIESLELTPEPGRPVLISLCRQYCVARVSNIDKNIIHFPSYISSAQQTYIRNFAEGFLFHNTYTGGLSADWEIRLVRRLNAWSQGQTNEFDPGMKDEANNKKYGRKEDWRYMPYIQTKQKIAALNEGGDLIKKYVGLLLISKKNSNQQKEFVGCIEQLKKKVLVKDSSVNLNQDFNDIKTLLDTNAIQTINPEFLDVINYYLRNISDVIFLHDLYLLRFWGNADPAYLTNTIEVPSRNQAKPAVKRVSPLKLTIHDPYRDWKTIDYLWQTIPKDSISNEDLETLFIFAFNRAKVMDFQKVDVLRVKQLAAKKFAVYNFNDSTQAKELIDICDHDPVTFLRCLLTSPCNSLDLVSKVLENVAFWRENLSTDIPHLNSKEINKAILDLLPLMAAGELDCHFLTEIVGNNKIEVEPLRKIAIANKNQKFLRELVLFEKSQLKRTLTDKNTEVNNCNNAEALPQYEMEMRADDSLEDYLRLCEQDPMNHSRYRTAKWLQKYGRDPKIIRIMYAALPSSSKLYQSWLYQHDARMECYNGEEYRIALELFRQLNELETSRTYKRGSITEKSSIANKIDMIHTAITLLVDDESLDNFSLPLRNSAVEKILAVAGEINTTYNRRETKLGNALFKLMDPNSQEDQNSTVPRQSHEKWHFSNGNKAFFSQPTIIRPVVKSNSSSLFYNSEFSKRHSRTKTAEWLQKILDDNENYTVNQKITLLYWAYETLYQQGKKGHLTQVVHNNLINLAGLNPERDYSHEELVAEIKHLGYREDQTTFREKLLQVLFEKLHKYEKSSIYKNKPSDTSKITSLHEGLEALLMGNKSKTLSGQIFLHDAMKEWGAKFLKDPVGEELLVNYAGDNYKFNQWCDLKAEAVNQKILVK